MSVEARVARARRWASRAHVGAFAGLGASIVSVLLIVADRHTFGGAPLIGLVLGLAGQLAAAAFGVLALLARRGTDAPLVVSRSVAAIGLGALAFFVACCIGLGLSGFGP